MERSVVEQFKGKFVRLKKKMVDSERTSFNIFCEIQDVTDESVIIFSDRLGAILLRDVVAIEEAPREKPSRGRCNY